MDRFMLTEAFNLAEEVEEFNLSASGLNDLDSFLDMAGDTSMEDTTIDIIDLEAAAEEELKQSYIGKVILDCNVCHSNIFFDKADVVVDEENGIANTELECPYCHSIGDGYTVIGEVKPYEEAEAEIEEEELPVEDVVEEPEENLEESLNESTSCLIEGLDAEEAEEFAYEIANQMQLSYDDYMQLVHDMNNLRADEWLKDVAEYCSEETTQKFKDIFNLNDENLDEALKADKVKELRKADELNGKLGLGRELESSDEVRGPHYTELNEEVEEDVVEEAVDRRKASIDKILGEKCEKKVDECMEAPILEESIDESIQDVSITTDDETMTMTTKEDGGVSIETTPIEEVVEEADEEALAPLSDETIEEIKDNNEEAFEEEIPEEVSNDEMTLDDLEDFDEESFNGLGESYLKECYDNVDSFKTTSVGLHEGVLTIEGNIGFNSGNEKATKFVFEGLTSNGRQKLNGCNEQISRGKKSFKLGCNVEDGKLVCESLNYNYRAKNENNKSVRVYGTIKPEKGE